ncbi:MAG: helix-turn-helix domain-containing protein [Pyrinomonadaceae bacterium]
MDRKISHNLEPSPFDLRYQQISLESKILVAFERIAGILRVLLWEKAKRLNLSPIQIQILIFFKFHNTEKSTVSYLANEFGLTKATVSDAVAVLEKKGLIEKKQSLVDARSFLHGLTTKGEETALQLENFGDCFREIFVKLPENEKDVLWHIMSRVIHHSTKKGLINIQRMCFNCKYYKETKDEFYCHLLGQELDSREIRLDCPEFIELEAEIKM